MQYRSEGMSYISLEDIRVCSMEVWVGLRSTSKYTSMQYGSIFMS